MVNNKDFTSISFGAGGAASLEINLDTDNMDEIDISDNLREASWFIQLIFEEIEDLDIYEE